MTETAERNGVLLFVAPESQSITVIGDRDVHARCGEAFWAAVAETMRDEFRAGPLHRGHRRRRARGRATSWRATSRAGPARRTATSCRTRVSRGS